MSVGRLGELTLPAGYFVYIGSAFGPGGVAARVARHCRCDKPLRWHIDYLRSVSEPVGVWFSDASAPLEHEWARQVGQAQLEAIPGFGCSDCQCPSHLFTARVRRDLDKALASLSGAPVYDMAFVRQHRRR